MHISDLVGQYHQGTASRTEKLTGTKGVENLVSSLRSLTKGNIFEGTVSSMKNGRVTLALSSGQQVTARIDGKVSLNVGQSMFFQVKSNDGTQIAIRPFVMDGTGGNYALMQALSAAGLPAESNYLSMVNRMMEEQMPIDRASLQQMARLVNANGDINVQTLVQLQKLGIPITPENASQFENYLSDRQAITGELDRFIEELPASLQGGELPEGQMRQMSSEVLSIITEGLPDVPQQVQTPDAQNPAAAQPEFSGENPAVPLDIAPETQNPADEVIQQPGQEITKTGEQADIQAAEQENAQQPDQKMAQQASRDVTQTSVQDTVSDMQRQPLHTLGAILSPEQLEHVNQMIGKLLGTENTNYTKDSGAVEMLRDLEQVLKDSLPVEREQLGKLFGSEEFRELIRDTLEQQWLVTPAELKESDRIGRLYEKLSSQMERISNAMKAVGQESTGINQMAADIRSNVEFMNQINQFYTYVQIPLKMSGQNASGELYVYTNKKALEEGNKELTAFLHLDMDHLGPTDVSVRLKGNEVSTNFYLDSDAAYALIEKNYPVLEARLRKKGYDCKISVINEEKHVNFVEDFLKKDLPSAGQLHRYSFDMRA